MVLGMILREKLLVLLFHQQKKKQIYRPTCPYRPTVCNDYYVLECSGTWKFPGIQYPAFPKVGGISRLVVPHCRPDVRLVLADNQWWRLTRFCGHPDANQRSHSWELLRRLASLHELLWVCLGDFNKVLDSSEKLGRVPKSFSSLSEFREVLDDYGLEDLGYVGHQFTWCNKRE
ncbi:hypothetical protein LWI28_022445 [Acer negundo]|uniref:Uncharacterized protein n=1 Tax=Acer negundo TaxID=4023 RepID=A0AAD5NY26_ACENE|nr:hypothetical protein LWI28_022445 [Acer negundo]